MGALVVEKHFTLDKTLTGNDHYHSMDTNDARKIINGIDFINAIRGTYDIKCLETELIAKMPEDHLVAKHLIKKGEIILKMLTFKRPGTGISPADIDNVIGKIAVEEIAEDTILEYKMIK